MNRLNELRKIAEIIYNEALEKGIDFRSPEGDNYVIQDFINTEIEEKIKEITKDYKLTLKELSILKEEYNIESKGIECELDVKFCLGLDLVIDYILYKNSKTTFNSLKKEKIRFYENL